MSPNRPLLGFWLETESQTACELAASLGYELMILDMEHGVISPSAADRLIVFSKSLALTVFSRVSAAERCPHPAGAGCGGGRCDHSANSKRRARSDRDRFR